MVRDTNTRMGTDTHMGEARVFHDICMVRPHANMGCPYASETANMCMSKILIWDGKAMVSTANRFNNDY